MLKYLQQRARTQTTSEILERIRTAAFELESLVASVDPKDIRQRPFPGKWHIADVVDHISQTQIRGAEEMRHLVAGRRPPGPPVYEGLKSGGGESAPWPTLVEGLKDANREMLSVIEEGGRQQADGRSAADEAAGLTVFTVVVANCKLPDERIVPQIFYAALDWRQYALLQRLHLVDHRAQIRRLLKALADDRSLKSDPRLCLEETAGVNLEKE